MLLKFFLQNRFVRVYGVAALVFIVGAIAGWGMHIGFWFITTNDRGKVVREGLGKYEFINPLLACDISEKSDFREFQPLRQKTNSKINNYLNANTATDVAVYFRDLETGRWIGINEDQPFSPASLLKIVVMMTYFKMAEADPKILSKELYYDGSVDANNLEHYSPINPLSVGLHPVSELIERMIVDSGNNSRKLLHDNIPNENILSIYKDLNLPEPNDQESVDFLSARAYGSIFRALYSSTYLSREMSEKALKILSKTNFNQGIVNGVPSYIKISHKFGERSVLDKTGAILFRELHECGIIYYPTHPYFLCVMTKGREFSDLESILEGISRVVYQEAVKVL